jgi:hypothetical protein
VGRRFSILVTSEDMTQDSEHALAKPAPTQRSVFIVRIWLEPREVEAAPAECRGVVEHVASGQRRFFRELGDLDEFIRGLSCIEASGASRR